MSTSADDWAAIASFNAGEVDDGVVGAARTAIEAAKQRGVITDMDAGAVAVVLRMAERMDDPDFPYVEGRFDNVTEGLFVKLCNELGLTPAGRSKMPEKVEQSKGKLGELRMLEKGRRSGAAS